jgi:hypothetical protein
LGGLQDWTAVSWRPGLNVAGWGSLPCPRGIAGTGLAMLMITLVLMTLLAVFPGRLMHDVLFGG